MLNMHKRIKWIGALLLILVLIAGVISVAQAAAPMISMTVRTVFLDDHDNALNTRGYISGRVLQNGEDFSSWSASYSSTNGYGSGTVSNLPLYDNATGEMYDYSLKLTSSIGNYQLDRTEFDATFGGWVVYLKWQDVSDYTTVIELQHCDLVPRDLELNPENLSLTVRGWTSSTWSRSMGAPDTVERVSENRWKATWKDVPAAHQDADKTKGEWSTDDDNLQYLITLKGAELYPYYLYSASGTDTESSTSRNSTFSFEQRGLVTHTFTAGFENQLAHIYRHETLEPYCEYPDVSGYSVWLVDANGVEVEGTRAPLTLTVSSDKTSATARYERLFCGYDAEGKSSGYSKLQVRTDFDTSTLPAFWHEVKPYSDGSKRVAVGYYSWRFPSRSYSDWVVWEDDDNAAGLRPTSFTMQHRLADEFENAPGADKIVFPTIRWQNYSSSGADWYYPLYDLDGNELEYVLEADLPKYYRVEVVETNRNRNDGTDLSSAYDYLNVTKKLKISLPTRTMSATVAFENELEEGKNRPTSVNFILKYADGTSVSIDAVRVADAGNNWTVTWDAPLYNEEGELAEYIIEPDTFLPLHALDSTSPVITTTTDPDTQETTTNYAFTYVEQENWNYAIDLIWDESDPAKWYDQYEIAQWNNKDRTYKYKLTIRVNAAHYDTGKLEVRLPYYLQGVSYTQANGVYTAIYPPAAVGVPMADSYNASNPFNYYIDTHDTAAKGDDEIVFKNWTPITDSINQTIEVQYNVCPSEMRDTVRWAFQATGKGIATYQTESGEQVEQPAEIKTSRAITCGIDNGIGSVSVSNSGVKAYHDATYRNTTLDHDNYIYLLYDLCYSTYYTQHHAGVFKLETNEGAEVVATYDRQGSNNNRFTAVEGDEFSWAKPGLFTPTSNYNNPHYDNMYSSFQVLVRYPRDKIDLTDEAYNIDYKIQYTATGMHPHENDKVEGLDYYDVATAKREGTYIWKPYQYVFSGDIYAFNKNGYELPAYGLEYFRIGTDIAEGYFYASTSVRGELLGRPYQIITDDDAMYACTRSKHNGSATEWVMMTGEDYSYRDAKAYISWSLLDLTTGETTSTNKPAGEFMLQGQTSYGGPWTTIDTFNLDSIKGSSANIEFDDELFEGKGYTGMRIVSPEGLEGYVNTTLYVYPVYYADSPLIQSYMEMDPAYIWFDNYSGHYVNVYNEETGEYDWFNPCSTPFNITNANTNGLNDQDFQRLGRYVIRHHKEVAIGEITHRSQISKKLTATNNDTANSKVDVTFTVNATEAHMYGNKIPGYLEAGAWQEGVFYDLLPPGYTFNDTYGVKVTGASTYAHPASLVKVETVDNYKNSGRQLVRFYVRYDGEEGKNHNYQSVFYSGCYGPAFTVTYTASISWTEWSYAPSGYNLVAFQEGHGDEGVPIYNAYDDDGAYFDKLQYGENINEVMSDLNGDGKTSGKNTLCSALYFSVDVVGAYATGVNKLVKANSGYYRIHDIADLGGAYSYKINFMASDGGTTKDLVLFDILEEAANTGTTNGVANSGEIWWEGTLAGIDVGLPRRQGIVPRVFYTTSDTLTYTAISNALNDEKTPVRDYLDDTSIWQEWTSDAPPADLSAVTALAFDLTTNAEGNPYVFEGSSATYVEIFMQAPSVLPEAVLAYNRPSYYTTFTTGAQHAVGTSTHNINDRVTVELRDLKDFSFIKLGEESVVDGEKIYKPLSGIEFKLYQCSHECSLGCEEGCTHTHTGKPGAADACWNSTPIRTTFSMASGEVSFNKLSSGSYAIMETAGRTAYVTPTNNWWVIDVDATAGGGVSDPVNAGTAAPHVSIEKDVEGNYSLKNDRVLKMLRVSKSWLSEGSLGKTYRPSKLVFDLYQNDKLYREGIEFDVTTTSNSQTYYINDIYSYDPTGAAYTYKLVERTVPGYSATITMNSYSSSEYRATVENKLLGFLQISKQVVNGSVDKAFTFLIDLQKDGSAVTDEICVRTTATDGTAADSTVLSNEDGLYAVNARHGETVLLMNLPIGATYAVAEQEEAGFASTVASGSVSGTVQQNTVPCVSFTNTYTAEGSIALTAKKVLEGRKLQAGQFSFTLTDANGKTYNAKNAEDGSITFEPLIYSEADIDRTYEYTIAEVVETKDGYAYDSAQHTVKVTVTDNGDGTLDVTADKNGADLTFTNTYEAEGEIVLTARKLLGGREMEAEQFSFTLTDEIGNELTAKNAKDGSITFDALTYTEADAGKEFVYTVAEVIETKAGYTYDTAKHTVTVTVEDNGDGTLDVTADKNGADLTFTNTYEAEGEIVLTAQKVLDGREMEAGQFSFTLTDANGSELTAKNAKDGSITFDALTYTEADAGKEFVYTVAEVIETKAGYTYDTAKHTIIVTVEDNGDGTLDVTADKNGADLTFTNTYEAEGEIVLTAQKVLDGREMEAEQFSFTLTDANGSELTAKNAKDGSITFDALTYTAVDAGKEFVYTVAEVIETKAGYTYDTAKHTVTVTVEDNGDGTLDVTADKNGADLTFTNTYEAANSLTLRATKTVNGAAPAEDEDGLFTFEVKQIVGQGGLTETLTAKNEGTKVTFKAIEYTLDDVGKTYMYSVKEKQTEIPGYTTDAAEYTVAVWVEDAGDGTLKITKAISRDGKAVAEMTFDNTYEAEGELTLEAIKTVNGAEPTEEQSYDFALTGDAEQKVKNEKGAITFDTLTYDLDDAGKTYTYTVKELGTSTDLLAIDDSKYTIEVSVTDNRNGTLKINSAITKDGEEVENIEFHNEVYAPLTIAKTVEGIETEEKFEFTVKLYDAKGTELNEAYAYTGDAEGEIRSGDSIRLGHGESITIQKLKPGMKYNVEETAEAAYTNTVNGYAATLAEGELTEATEVLFVNHYKTTTFTVMKKWIGGNGSIELTLYANGEKLSEQPVYTMEDNVYTYTDLPMYDENGKFIVYSAREKYVDGYLTIYSNVKPYAEETKMIYDGGTIINKRIVKADFAVQKKWTGLEEGESAPEITLVLYCNGVATDVKTPKVSNNGWYKYYDLPGEVDGKPAVYTVKELPVDGFETSYELADGTSAEYADNGGVITNSKIPQTGDESNIALWSLLTLASAAGMLLLLKRRKA